MMDIIGFTRLLIVISVIGSAAANVCAVGITNDTAISTRDGSNNPAFVQSSTGTVFFKYDTPILDASEAELVAMEYTGRYEKDMEGVWWVVSREGKPLSRMTKMYGENFATTPLGPGLFEYEYSATEYSAALQIVRGNHTLQNEAMEWAAQVKSSYWERYASTGGLVKKYIACGPFQYVCQDSTGCQLFGGNLCDVCLQGRCYDQLLPDGC